MQRKHWENGPDEWTKAALSATGFCLAKPLRLRQATKQAVLDGRSVRLIAPAEADRWNALVTERHYLKNAQLVGEQLRYVGEYQGQWLDLLG